MARLDLSLSLLSSRPRKASAWDPVADTSVAWFDAAVGRTDVPGDPVTVYVLASQKGAAYIYAPSHLPELGTDANGLPYLLTNGTNTLIQGSYGPIAQPYTRVWIGKYVDPFSTYDYAFDGVSTNSRLYRSDATTANVNAGIDLSWTDTTTTAVHDWVIVFEAGIATVYRSGVLVASGNVGNAGADGLTLGSRGDDAWWGKTWFYAGGDFSGAKDLAWVAKVHSYCEARKWVA